MALLDFFEVKGTLFGLASKGTKRRTTIYIYIYIFRGLTTWTPMMTALNVTLVMMDVQESKQLNKSLECLSFYEARCLF